MPKIIDIPYGTYLAYVAECNITDQYLDLGQHRTNPTN